MFFCTLNNNSSKLMECFVYAYQNVNFQSPLKQMSQTTTDASIN